MHIEICSILGQYYWQHVVVDVDVVMGNGVGGNDGGVYSHIPRTCETHIHAILSYLEYNQSPMFQ